MNPDFLPKPPDAAGFIPLDLHQISDAPSRSSRHRRSLSDTFFGFSDDFLFDAPDLEIPPSEAPLASSGPPRSFSMDADFFEGLSFGAAVFDGGDRPDSVAVTSLSGENRAGFHRRNKSMDGLSSSFEADSVLDGAKKSMPPEKLAELALMDPKRARRILANRQSAARSKERRVRHAGELEKKVQTLQTEATNLSAQVTILQRDTTGLTSENRELKLRLEAMEQQAHLKDALNETLKEEVKRLRMANNRSLNPFGSQQTQQPQFHIPQPSSNPFGSQHTQQPHLDMPQPSSNPFSWPQNQQPQFHIPQSSTSDPNSVQQLQSSFLGFNPRG